MFFKNILNSIRTLIKRGRVSFSLSYKLIKIISFIISILYILGVIYEFGFYDIHPQEYKLFIKLQDLTWSVFSIHIIFSSYFDYKKNKGSIETMKVIYATLFFLSVMPYIFPNIKNCFLTDLWNVLGSNLYLSILLSIYAISLISRGIINFISSKINPALMFMVSFLIIIVIGMGLLLLPKSTIESEYISWVDALFVSTSAVCVTGLTPVDISSLFTFQGQFIILLLIQIGGLGVMTFTCFLAIFFISNTSLSNQLIIKDMISSDSFSSLISILLQIIAFTFVIELCGTALIFWEIHGNLSCANDIYDEIFFSVFHSISAFCNAGFSTMKNNLGNPLLMEGHNMLYIIISGLVILGGIGFPVLVNYKTFIVYKLKNLWSHIFHPKKRCLKRLHIINITTKIVSIWTIGLLIFGTVMFCIFEWNGSFADMSLSDKITHAFFNSACARTAGFTGVDLTGFALQSLLIYIVLMWIGGASQSTAGGIKINSISIAMKNLITVLQGKNHVEIFKREISQNSIKKANATIIASIATLFIFIFIISIIEPEIPFKSIVFECVSAIGTVGSSLNVTGILGETSKLLISLLMFIGRIGVISFMISFMPQVKLQNYKFPKEHIII